MKVTSLPQLCRRCRNSDIGGMLKAPDQGKFFKSKKYNRAPIWVCNPCLARGRPKQKYAETYIERQVREALQGLHVSFIQQHQVGPYRYDFAIPKLRLLIEVDGRKWHRTRKQKQRDILKEIFPEKWNWKVVRIKNGSKLGLRATRAIGERKMELAVRFAGDKETALLVISEGII